MYNNRAGCQRRHKPIKLATYCNHKIIMQLLRQSMPVVPRLADLVAYSDATYVTGTARAINWPNCLLRIHRIPPLFPPEKWNVHEATLADGTRRNNVCEGWSNGFHQLVGHSKPSVWVAIEALQMDEALATTSLLKFARGEATARHVQRDYMTIRTTTRCGGGQWAGSEQCGGRRQSKAATRRRERVEQVWNNSSFLHVYSQTPF